METFTPLPPPPQQQPPSANTATVNTTFAAPNIVNTIPIGAHEEVQNSLNHPVANPTPTAGPGNGPSSNPHHPPYAEMIYSAIGALKERDGSSKRAIAKYIEQAYTGLPSTHSALLTNHLKRLKNNGLLVMVKKSYKLPKSHTSATASPASTLPTTGTPRGRGRPPKAKSNPNADPIVQTTIQPILQPGVQPIMLPTSQPVELAQGAAGFVPRGRGRPPGSKSKLVGNRLSKKSPGHPRKPKSVTGVLGPKRSPGRPSKAEPKTMIIPYATNVPVVGVVDQNSIPNVLAVTPRPRGRPKKNAVLAGTTAGVGILSGKRRGRPPKVSGLNKIKNRTGRSVGRPRKNAVTLTVASDSLVAVNADLKRKLDYFQSKVKQAAGTLKPQLTHESPVTAIAAVQELEELATLDINAPLRDEVQNTLVQN